MRGQPSSLMQCSELSSMLIFDLIQHAPANSQAGPVHTLLTAARGGRICAAQCSAASRGVRGQRGFSSGPSLDVRRGGRSARSHPSSRQAAPYGAGVRSVWSGTQASAPRGGRGLSSGGLYAPVLPLMRGPRGLSVGNFGSEVATIVAHCVDVSLLLPNASY
jgi:hypothetical protein